MTEIVLTADRTLMSDFRGNYWLGFFSCLPKGILPGFVFSFFNRQVKTNKDGTVKRAPIGLRKVESLLTKLGKNVVIPSLNNLHNFIRKDTKIVGVSVMDPLGISPASFTAKILLRARGSASYSKLEFEKLMNKLKSLKEKYKFKVLVGGCGAWQLSNDYLMNKFGIDYVFQGEIERTLPKLIDSIEEGSLEEKVIIGEAVKPEEIIPISKPCINNVVEISRGCGRGCSFCTETRKGRMRYVPIETIMKEVMANVQGGSNGILLQSENFLEYGSKNFYPDEDTVMELYRTIYSVKNIKKVWPIHVNLASILANPELIEKLTIFLRRKGIKIYSCQPGLETGSSRLIKSLMPGKLLPFKNEEWEFIVKESFKIMHKNRWIPFASIIMGLPGETEEDIIQTIDLVKSLNKYDCMLTPMFFRRMGEDIKEGEAVNLNLNMELFKTCWKHNLKKVSVLLSANSLDHLTRLVLQSLFKFMMFFLKRNVLVKFIETLYRSNPLLRF